VKTSQIISQTMSSKVVVIDKENTGGVGGVSYHLGNKILAASDNIKKTPLSLKKVNNLQLLKSCDETQTVQLRTNSKNVKRRALGDVFNTTNSNKHHMSSSFVSSGTVEQKCFNAMKSSLTNKHETLLPPVESCHIYYDTFEDLFEETGKISSLFLNKNINYTARLPSGNSHIDTDTNKETFHQFEAINDDSNWSKNLKQLNKLLRKEKKHDFNQMDLMEMPGLEMPSILEDF